MIDKSKFTAMDTICYDLAVYDLTQLKQKSPKSYAAAVSKLTQNTSPDNDIIEALFLTYRDKSCMSIYRKFEKLCKQGVITA